MRLHVRAWVCVFVVAVFGSAFAQDGVVTGNGIPYASGGVGLDSREALQAKAGEYNLLVILSLKDGHYLGGAGLTVRNHAGRTVLKSDAKGPWVFAKLPSGSYSVEATARKRIRRNQLVIRKGTQLKRIHLTWI